VRRFYVYVYVYVYREWKLLAKSGIEANITTLYFLVANHTFLGDEKCIHSFSRKTWREENLGDLGVDAIIVKAIIKKVGETMWTALAGLGRVQLPVRNEHGHENSSSIKGGLR